MGENINGLALCGYLMDLGIKIMLKQIIVLIFLLLSTYTYVYVYVRMLLICS